MKGWKNKKDQGGHRKSKPNVGKDGSTILRVEPFNHHGKHTVRPYPQNGVPIYLPKGVKKEKKAYKPDVILEALDHEHSELCRRLDYGLSMKGSSIEEFTEFFVTNEEDILGTVRDVKALMDDDKGAKLKAACSYFNKDNEVQRNNDLNKEHVDALWKFFKSPPEDFEKLLRNGMMMATRALLGFSNLLELLPRPQKVVIRTPLSQMDKGCYCATFPLMCRSSAMNSRLNG